jgi:rhomboid family GlyGly-CTERM serine protease
MNAKAPTRGLVAFLESLNCDRGYGWALLAGCALLAIAELGGESVRQALSYDRAGLVQGQWWRVLTGHFVHLDAQHALVNIFGVVLMWALFARDYSPLRWATIYLAAALSISAGLWFLRPGIPWYVGASGVLHGVMAAGTLAHLRRRDLDAWILATFLVAKLCYEQIAGAMPFQDAGLTVVDAHLFGAIGGLAAAFLLRSRPRPQ